MELSPIRTDVEWVIMIYMDGMLLRSRLYDGLFDVVSVTVLLVQLPDRSSISSMSSLILILLSARRVYATPPGVINIGIICTIGQGYFGDPMGYLFLPLCICVSSLVTLLAFSSRVSVWLLGNE